MMRQVTWKIEDFYGRLYIVHMKYVTASDARKHWFQLLDEAAAGHTIAIDRNGTKLVLRAEKARRTKTPAKPIITGKDIDNADKWGWTWDRKGRLIPTTKK
jgi:hypothetical protein